MPPFAPMALAVNPIQFSMPCFASPWVTTSGLSWNPIGVAALRPAIVTPIAPAAPLSHRDLPATYFIRSPQSVAWRQLLIGHAGAPRVSFTPLPLIFGRQGQTGFVTATLHAASQHRPASKGRAALKQALSQPSSLHSNKGNYENKDRVAVDATRSDLPFPAVLNQNRASEPLDGRYEIIRDQESIAPERSSRSSEPLTTQPSSHHNSHQADQDPTDRSPLQSPLSEPAPTWAEPQAAGRSAVQQHKKPIRLGSMLSKRPGIDRSRLFDFQITQTLFVIQQQHSALSRSKMVPAQAASVETAAGIDVDGTEFPSSEIQTTLRATEPDRSSKPLSVDEPTEYELAGLANIRAAVQQHPESRLGLWFKQVLAAPPSQSRYLTKATQQILQLQTALAKTPSVVTTLQNELARLDGELRLVPLPHNLPNMGELSREILLSAQSAANPYSQQQTPSDQEAPQSPLARQIRQSHQDADYLDNATGQVRTLANAQEGIAYLHFLAHLARKSGMTLIAMINFVNQQIGFGDFLKHKNINGTIRSMDPTRWGKDSEVLLHPLMGRANVVINVLDLIESNRISIEEVRELLRIGTAADILNRLEVEIEAALIYRHDEDWWQEIWSGQDAAALKPWFDELLAQIRTSITDLKDVLRFVSDLETGTGANDNSVQLSA